MAELDWEAMPIHQAIKSDWKTPELLIEGSLNCAKTTVALDKEIDAVLRWPGIPILLFRWTDDAVSTKLRPALEAILAIRGITAEWDAKQKRYTFANGSMIYAFGLKSVSAIERFNKIRGLGVHRILGDQVEEMDRGVAAELRGRLRPDLTATVRGVSFPFQLTFVANPSDNDFWLSKEFPLDNRIKGRKVYSLSLNDNPKLPRESVESLLRTYAPDHPKHLTMILGRRGPNIDGDPIYEGIYRKDLHWRQTSIGPTPLLEGYEFGKHNPVWVVAQQIYTGGLQIHAGIIGEQMMLHDFLPVVSQYRQEWGLTAVPTKSCSSPMGGSQARSQPRHTALDIMRREKIKVVWTDSGNGADVRGAMIENIATYLRQRNAKGEECFAVNNDPSRFLIVSAGDPTRQSPFIHHALEAGYVWDKHYVSVSNKELRQPYEDDKFANVMHAIENIELNFCAGRPTKEQADAREVEKRQSGAALGPSGPNSWMGF